LVVDLSVVMLQLELCMSYSSRCHHHLSLAPNGDVPSRASLVSVLWKVANLLPTSLHQSCSDLELPASVFLWRKYRTLVGVIVRGSLLLNRFRLRSVLILRCADICILISRRWFSGDSVLQCSELLCLCRGVYRTNSLGLSQKDRHRQSRNKSSSSSSSTHSLREGSVPFP